MNKKLFIILLFIILLLIILENHFLFLYYMQQILIGMYSRHRLNGSLEIHFFYPLKRLIRITSDPIKRRLLYNNNHLSFPIFNYEDMIDKKQVFNRVKIIMLIFSF